MSSRYTAPATLRDFVQPLAELVAVAAFSLAVVLACVAVGVL